MAPNPIVVDFVQIFAGLSFVGVCAAGILAITQSPGFSVTWGSSWTSNTNAGVVGLLYGAVVAALGLLGFVATWRMKGWLSGLYDWKTLSVFSLLAGAVSLGASANTGIVFGSSAMLFGLLEFLLAHVGGVLSGRHSISNFFVPELLVKLIQMMGAVAGLGVVAAAIVGMVNVGGSSVLVWCSGGGKRCWDSALNTDYAFFGYGVALIFAGLCATVACLRLKGWLSYLYHFEKLGPFLAFVGFCTLGVAGNTGILFGGILISTGASFVVFYLFSQRTEGYTAF